MIQPVSTRRIILTLLLAAASSSLGAQSREVVEIIAERFTFTPSKIEVEVGTMVEIHLRSEDTDHGFRLADGTNVIIPKRRLARRWSSSRPRAPAPTGSSARNSVAPAITLCEARSW